MLIISGEFDLSVGSNDWLCCWVYGDDPQVGFRSCHSLSIFCRWFHNRGLSTLRNPKRLTFDGNFDHPMFDFILRMVQWGGSLSNQGYLHLLYPDTLGGLFFLRGLTEVSYRAFNKKEDQTAGSTTVTDLPDIKNIIDVPGHGEMEREAAKALPNDQLLEVLKTAPEATVAKLTEQLSYANEKVAATKTILQESKMLRLCNDP